VRFSSLLGKHTLSDEAVAEGVKRKNKIILVSSEKLQVEVEVDVADVKHVLEILMKLLVFNLGKFFKIVDLVKLLRRKLGDLKILSRPSLNE
jgi:hypothetical protein